MKDINVVIGCVDKYASAWLPFKHGLEKYWGKERPWDIVFITNYKDFPGSYKTIKVGEDHSWSETVRKGLEQVKTPYIMWMMEDYWLTGKVRTQTVIDFYNIMKRDNLNHIRILPPADAEGIIKPYLELKCPYPKDNRLWIFQDDANYRASLATSLWKKEVFMSILQDGWSPWQFELEGGKKSRGNDLHLCAIEPDIVSWGWRTNPYPNCKSSPIRKGQWTESAFEYIKQEKLDVDLSWHPHGARVSLNTRIRYPEYFNIKRKSFVDDFCYFSTRIEIGEYSHIASGCSIAGGSDMGFVLGDFCSLSSGVKIWCASNDFVNDLIILNPGIDIGAKNCKGNIIIGNYVGIGANSVIMPNNNILEGVAIGGLSWCPSNFSFKPWTVYAGIPIREVKPRNKENILRQVKIIKEQLR